MVTVKSKIKTIFGKDEKLLRYIGAICDTKRIESNAEKMVTLSNLLYTYEVPFQFLGGATNRLALQIDGYAVKFAMDEQGYLDNLIEYSLSPELQPYVTKSYETNGYILIAECVELMTNDKWELYRTEIRKVLDRLCNDYLLGDVGYIKKNMTNWGIRENKPVILDYAYCHRFTENLFTCSRCGSPLTYDSTYDKLMCTDRSGCRAVYTYNDRKRIQGKQVDIDMIKERKGESIRLPKGVISKDIAVIEDRMIGDNAVIIDNPGDYYRYIKMKEEGKLMTLNIEEGEETMETNKLDLMIRMLRNPQDEEAKQLLYQNLSEEEPEPIYTENYQSRYMFGGPVGDMRTFDETNGCDYGPQMVNNYNEEEEDDFDPSVSLNNIIAKMVNERNQKERDIEDVRKRQEDEYLADLKKRQEAAAGVPITVTVQDDDNSANPVQTQSTLESESEPEPVEEEPVMEAPSDYSVATQVDTPEEESEEKESTPEELQESLSDKCFQATAPNDESVESEETGEPVEESTPEPDVESEPDSESEAVVYSETSEKESEKESEMETIKVNGVEMEYGTKVTL